MNDLPDHPVVRNMENTGYPDGKAPEYPRCPVCWEECETIYRDAGLEIVGCENCISFRDAWDVPECFTEKEDLE